MTTTTPQDGTQDEAPGQETEGGRGGQELPRERGRDDGAPQLTAGRGGRLIRTETTMEIPVHLLFREEGGARADGTGPAGRPAVLGRPVAATYGPSDPATRRLGPGLTPVAGTAAATGQGRTTPRTAAATRTVPVLPAAAVPAERRARALPGLLALAAGLLGLAGAALALWRTRPEPGPLPLALALAGGTLALLAFAGLERGRVGTARVLTFGGRYRGSVRRTGLLWTGPLARHRIVDVRLRHWRSEPVPGVDARGNGLRVVLLVVWRVADTARASFAVADHGAYLRDSVEAAVSTELSRLPADAPPGARSLRDTEALGEALTRQVAADVAPAGLEVYAVRPLRLDYAPELEAAMHRTRVAALDAEHREETLRTVLDAVEDTVAQLTARDLVTLDDYERRALVRDLTIAFYGTGTAPLA